LAAKVTRTYFGNANFFGGPGATSCKGSVKLKMLEDQNADAMMVFLSDVWLDRNKVLSLSLSLYLSLLPSVRKRSLLFSFLHHRCR